MTTASPPSDASGDAEGRRAAARAHAKNARHAAYRDLVVEAAGEAFARDGVAATRMESLAEAAGISLGTLYSVYRGKAEIVDALHASRLREIHAASIEAEGTAPDPLEALLAGSRAYLAYFMARPDYLRMYLDEGANWGVRRSMDRDSRRAAVWGDGVARLTAIFERGIDEGVFEPGNPDRLARTMLAMQQVLLADWYEDGARARAQDVMNEMEVLLRRAFCTAGGRAPGA
ncbi:MAG: TetR/AcrR family transcriptional regulator [Myxococcota bacterium]